MVVSQVEPLRSLFDSRSECPELVEWAGPTLSRVERVGA